MLEQSLHFPCLASLKPTGKFSVGYKRHDGKDQFQYCVFYPTLNPTKQRPKFLSDAGAWRKYLEIVQGKSKFPPKGIFEMLTHIFTKVKLFASVNSPIISAEEVKQHISRTKLVPVIFSHGMGANKHNYASTLCQLASQGYFVVSIDHRDEVKFIIEHGMEQAQKFLEKRVNDVQRLIDEMTSRSGSLSALFEKVELDMNYLTVMGHSYGGATSYVAAWKDERIKKYCYAGSVARSSPAREFRLRNLAVISCCCESDEWSGLNPEAGINAKKSAGYGSAEKWLDERDLL